MLCAGVIHGDLSEFNILATADGPVIIDLPQAVDAAGNTGAGEMLVRDVANLAAYFSRFAPGLQDSQYGKEIWALYQAGLLTPDTPLTGYVAPDETRADVGAVLREIEDARLEEEARQRYLSAVE
jgi:RIO kinase 1